jgi:aminoglycoside 3-N-acetyltransferase
MPEHITKKQIVDDLKKLGLRAGDVVIVHSALAAIGNVEGGADTVIKALLDVLTPSGTLVMPAFGGEFPYNHKTTKSNVGVITEAFRNYPGVKRSFHPTHSVSALGPKADELIRDHIKSPTACGKETPFGRLIDMCGKILLLGVDNDRNTMLHTLEEYAQAPYLSDRQFSYYNEKGEVENLKLKWFPGPHRDFIGLDPLFRMTEVMKTGKVGHAVARLIDAKKMIEVGLHAFEDDPAVVLCDNPNCGDCVMQRRKIRLARLNNEDFTLSALASSISPWPDEIAEEMSRAGIYDLIVDRLYNLPLSRLNENKLHRAAETLASENIMVGAIHATADITKFDQALAYANILKTQTIIIPLVPNAAAFLDEGRKHNISVLFENTSQTASMCLNLLKDLKGQAILAFNPANFALVGENAFLSVYRGTSLRQYVKLLYLNDATFGGEYTLPAEGNAEVKELLSIVRCRSFDGRIVLATGPGGPKFREMVEGFWYLMESL